MIILSRLNKDQKVEFYTFYKICKNMFIQVGSKEPDCFTPLSNFSVDYVNRLHTVTLSAVAISKGSMVVLRLLVLYLVGPCHSVVLLLVH